MVMSPHFVPELTLIGFIDSLQSLIDYLKIELNALESIHHVPLHMIRISEGAVKIGEQRFHIRTFKNDTSCLIECRLDMIENLVRCVFKHRIEHLDQIIE